MRITAHTTQVYTLFGGAYVPEDHGRGPDLDAGRAPSLGGWAAVLGTLLIGVTTAAAFTTTHVGLAGLN